MNSCGVTVSIWAPVPLEAPTIVAMSLVRKFQIKRGGKGEFTEEHADQKTNAKQLYKLSGVSHGPFSIPYCRISEEQTQTSAITNSTILCEAKISAIVPLRLLEIKYQL